MPNQSSKQDPRWRELFAMVEATRHRPSDPQARYVSTPAKAAKAIGVSLPLLTQWLADGCPGDEGYSVVQIAAWHRQRFTEPRIEQAAQILNLASKSTRYLSTLDEVGDLFGVSKTAVWKWKDAGAPDRTEKGYDVQQIAAWLANRETEAALAAAINVPTSSTDRVNTPEQVAAVFGVYEATVRKWFAKGAPRSRGYHVEQIRKWGIENPPLQFVQLRAR